MSIGYVRAVLEMKNPAGLHRLLLMVIAEHANNDGFASPGNDCLAAESTISLRQIQRIIPQLVDDGLLEIAEAGNGRGRIRQIKLLFPPAIILKGDKSSHPLDSERVTNNVTLSAKKGDIKGDKRVTFERERVTFEPIKGDMAPEVEGDNQLEPITTTNNRVEDLDGIIAAPPAQSQPLPIPPPTAYPINLDLPKPPTEAQMAERIETSVSVVAVNYKPSSYAKGLYLKGARLVSGYIAPGAGVNAVQVYHERHSADDPKLRLTDPQQDDLAKAVTDLDRWRVAVTAWSLAGYNPRNIGGQIEWYEHGVPERGSKYATPNNGRIASGSSGASAQQSRKEPISDWIFVPRAPDPNLPF